MDPTANLSRLLALAREVKELVDKSGDDAFIAQPKVAEQLCYHADEMAELIDNLNEWIVGSGGMPMQWRKEKRGKL